MGDVVCIKCGKMAHTQTNVCISTHTIHRYVSRFNTNGFLHFSHFSLGDSSKVYLIKIVLHIYHFHIKWNNLLTISCYKNGAWENWLGLMYKHELPHEQEVLFKFVTDKRTPNKQSILYNVNCPFVNHIRK